MSLNNVFHVHLHVFKKEKILQRTSPDLSLQQSIIRVFFILKFQDKSDGIYMCIYTFFISFQPFECT